MKLTAIRAYFASSSLEAATAATPELPTQWEVCFMPVGTHALAAGGGDDGQGFEGEVTIDEQAFNDIAASLSQLTAEGWEFWIDTDHSNGEAVGWLKSLRWDPMRGILAQVQWTPKGAEMIRTRAYKSFSPTFLVNRETRRPWSLVPAEAAGSLVNAPAFRAMPDLVAASMLRSDSLAARCAAQPTNTMPPKPAEAAPAANVTPAAALAPAGSPEVIPVRASADPSIGDLVKMVNELGETVKTVAAKVCASDEEKEEKVAASAKPAPTPAIVERTPTAGIVAGPIGASDALKAYASATRRTPLEAARVYAQSIAPLLKKGLSTRELTRVLAANSLGSLAGNLVVQRSLQLLKLKLPVLGAITTDFSSEAVQFNQQIITRTRGIPGVSVFDAANGYVKQAASTTDVPVTINNNIGVPIELNVNELASTNRDLFGEQSEGAVYAIAKYMVDALYALVTVSNYASLPTVKASGSFTRADVTAMAKALFDRGVPEDGRTLLLNSTYFEKLMSDPAIVSLATFQSRDLIEEYRLPKVGGFDVLQAVNLPTNSEDLVGFGFSTDALVMNARLPVDYTQALDGANNGAVSVVTDEDTGLSMQVVRYVNHDLARATWRAALMFGVAKGQTASLQRLRSTGST